MSGSSHGDRLRGIIARASEFGDVAEMANAAVELDALLDAIQQLRDALTEARPYVLNARSYDGWRGETAVSVLGRVDAALAAVRVEETP